MKPARFLQFASLIVVAGGLLLLSPEGAGASSVAREECEYCMDEGLSCGSGNAEAMCASVSCGGGGASCGPGLGCAPGVSVLYCYSAQK